MNEEGNDLVEDNPMAAPLRPRGDVWEQTKQRAGRARERTQLFLRENPIPMMIGAFAAGLGIGLAIRLTSDSKSETKASVRRFNWTLLPFLWPALKFVKENYETSAETVKDTAETVRENVDRYTQPIRKRWKSWTH